MRKTVLALLMLLVSLTLSASGYVASTSWVGSYMDLAGIDDFTVIAPSTLRHPPEYELKPSDIRLLTDADLFVYAGYEKMMEVISSSLVSETRNDLRISTGNNLDNVEAQVMKIAEAAGTQPRLDEYRAVIERGREIVREKGLDELKVLCHTMHLPLAKDLGLNIAASFGPAEMSPSEIADAAGADYDLIIDNVHNPVAGPAAEVSDAVVLIWRNFPEENVRGALADMVWANIELLERAF